MKTEGVKKGEILKQLGKDRNKWKQIESDGTRGRQRLIQQIDKIEK
jgi:hypothetical protein